MIAGAQDPAPQLLRRGLAAGAGPASLYFSGESAPAPEAAWINGTAGHALDYDDIGCRGHLSTVLVPTILAEAVAVPRHRNPVADHPTARTACAGIMGGGVRNIGKSRERYAFVQEIGRASEVGRLSGRSRSLFADGDGDLPLPKPVKGTTLVAKPTAIGRMSVYYYDKRNGAVFYFPADES